MLLPHPRVKLSIVGSLRHREVACSTSDRRGSNSESCVWRTLSSHSSHHPQEVFLAQFSLYVHKCGLKPDSFHFLRLCAECRICADVPIFEIVNLNFIISMAKPWILTCSFMIKPVYCARPDQFKNTVDSYIRIYCFNNRLTTRVYFKHNDRLVTYNYKLNY